MFFHPRIRKLAFSGLSFQFITTDYVPKLIFRKVSSIQKVSSSNTGCGNSVSGLKQTWHGLVNR